MQTKHFIPLSGANEGAAIVDFLITASDGLIEVRAVVIDAEGYIDARNVWDMRGRPKLQAASTGDVEPILAEAPPVPAPTPAPESREQRERRRAAEREHPSHPEAEATDMAHPTCNICQAVRLGATT